MISSSGSTSEDVGFIKTWWQRGHLPALLLVVATIIAYQPAWNAGFIWDDDRYVTNNSLLTAPDGLVRIWFSFDSPSQYFPLTYTTFRIERLMFWGLDPAGYHWMNILFHAVNALLVWRLLRQLGVPGSWLAAAIFALHPVQVESVAWISEWKNILSLCFFLLSLLAWTEFIEEQPKRSGRPYWWALSFFALALFSKTTACTLSVAMLLILWLKKKPFDRSRWAQLVPFVALGLGMGLIAMWWEHNHQGTEGRVYAIGLLDRILIASRAVWFYVGKLFWPANLTFSYPRWVISVSDPVAYLWLVVGAFACWAIYFARRFVGRSVEVAAAFYVAMLSPLLGFVMLYTFRYTFVADHYQYVASIGPIALAAAGIVLGLRSLGKSGLPLQVIFGGLLLGLLGALTWQQCRMYSDNETLWRKTLKGNPNSYMAHNNLGTALMRRKETDEAILHFQKAFEIQPDYAVAYFNLGNALIQKGQLDEAIAWFQKAVETDPDYAAAHINLGNALVRKGRVREAIVHLELSLNLRLKTPDVFNNLAWLLATSPDASIRNGSRAVELAQRASQLSGERNPVYLGTLAAAYAETGNFSEAIATGQHALDLASGPLATPLTAALQMQMESYRAGTAFRDTTTATTGQP